MKTSSIIFVMLLGLAVSGGCSEAIADRFSRPHPLPDRIELLAGIRAQVMHQWGDRFREFKYVNRNGLQLSACMLLPPPGATANGKPHGMIVFLHGFSDQKEGMLLPAERFAEHGYIAVCPDLRAHGQSEGQYTSFGYHERYDLVDLVNLLGLDGYDTSRVGAYGRSLGAATALLWAAIDSRVKAIVAVAPYDSLRAEANYIYSSQDPPLSRLKIDLLESAVQKVGQFKIDDVSPLKCMKSIRAPIYFLRGGKDDVVPPSESDRLFKAARGPAVIERIANAGHHDVVDILGDQFRERALEWMDCFLPSTGPEHVPDWTQAMAHRNIASPTDAALFPNPSGRPPG